MVHFKDGMIRKITVEDPTRKLETMELEINRQLTLNSDNATFTYNSGNHRTFITIDLPRDLYAGQSMVIQ